MAVQSQFFQIGEGRTFPSTKPIAKKELMAVWAQRIDDNSWEQISYKYYSRINNSAVIKEDIDLIIYQLLEVRVADTEDELLSSPSDIGIVVGIADEIVTVAGISDEVVTVAGIEGEVVIVSTNMAYIVTVANDIADVKTVATNIGNVNIVATNMASVLTVATNIGDINTTATNIANVNTVAINMDDINDVVTNMDDVNDVASTPLRDAILDATTDPLRQAIIDAPIHGDKAQLEAWIAEAEAKTADNFANMGEDVEVLKVTSNGDGSFTETALPNTFSSLHWSIKSGQAAVGLAFQSTWDASTGAYPTTRANGDPLEVGDLFVIDVAGSISGTDWFTRDWMIRNTTNDGWYRVPQVTDWNAVLNVPNNVVNAITNVELQAGLAPKANTTYVDAQVSPKADKTYVDSQNALQDTTIGAKADKTYVDSQNASQDSQIATKISSSQEGGVGRLIDNQIVVTQAEYDALTPSATTYYVIVG